MLEFWAYMLRCSDGSYYTGHTDIKPCSRAKKEALIAGDWALVSHFARPPNERPSTSLGTNER